MIVAIIPARGGSQRVPGKNIKPFLGKPIIAYSIETARESGLFDRVIVSTDDPEIAAVAKQYDAEIPFLRPASLSDAFTGTNLVVKHAIETIAAGGASVDYACCIYATAPFLQTGYLKEGLERLRRSDRVYAFSVTTYPFPVRRSIRITASGGVEPMFPDDVLKRSQDLEEAYHDAGQFYWGCARAFLEQVVVFSDAAIPVILPRYRVQDIDTDEDWRRAELMYSVLQGA